MTTFTIPRTTELQWQYETPLAGGLVVGFDGSAVAHAALESAAAIAAVRNCRVHVVSVLPPMSSYKIDLGLDQSRSEVEDLRIQLRDAAIRDAVGTVFERADWTREVAIGSAARKIVEVAEKRCADLIIVGRTHHGMLDRMLGGETMLQLMRISSVPVLVVADEMQKPSTVVAAIDFGPASRRAASKALEMLHGSGTLYLVYVDEPVEVFPDGFVVPAPDDHPEQLLKQLRKSADDIGVPSGVVVESVVLTGQPTRTISEFCERVGADLLVAGTHGLPHIARFLLGSVSTGLVRTVEKPVMIVPSKV